MQGSGIDSSLNGTGRAQARAFYEAYKNVPFDRIYTSGLKRSQESITSFINGGMQSEPQSGLNEISWGNREGQRITPEEDAYYRWLLNQWQEGKTSIPIEGGESPEQVALRQRPFLELLKSRAGDRTVLVCMHGRAMRILLCQFLHYPLRCMDMFEHHNLGLYLIHSTGYQCMIDLYNTTDHLSGLATLTEAAFMQAKK